jgi:flagellar hook-associated protein 3 FlgL
MNVYPIPLARISTQLENSLMLGSMQGNQSDLLTVQQQISTGQRLSQPSDDPAAATGIVQLRNQISDSTEFDGNLTFASGFLNTADSTLSSVSSLINQANSVTSQEVGTTATASERSAQASVVDSLITQALTLANTQYQGASVFGGANSTQNPFVSAAGGYKYQGSSVPQGILTPDGGTINYTVDGNQVFGGTSSQVVGYQNLTPALTATTQISDLGGATGNGVQLGTISITSGASTFNVDLTKASSIGDVQAAIQSALTAAGSAATVSLSGGHLTIAAGPSASISVADTGNGTTAADLGISGGAAAGASLTGTDLAPKITATTPLSALRDGAGIDPSGIIITNGANSATITLAGLNTVQDLINKINNSGTQVQASINSAGTGINLLNPVSGLNMTVGENGGNTADELGIRSFQAGTKLSDLNSGGGVTPISQLVSGPTGNITITKTNGTTFNVAMDGISTPSQLIAAINHATGNTTVTAALNSTGNGITLTDTSGGGGNISVAQASNYVSNGTDLGIFKTGSGNTLTGSNITFSTDDFRVTRTDGTSFTVNVTGAQTIQDALNAINNADGNAAGASHVTASLATTGNGIVLSDPTAGSGALTVTSLNSSAVAAQLGIQKTAGSPAGVINGSDTNPLPPQGLFSALLMLRNALASNDTAGIQRAGALLTQAASSVLGAQGSVAAQSQNIAAFKSQNSNTQTQLQQSLSNLADTDMTSAITQYQTLQTSYQAALKVAATANSLSLLNFLQ